MYTVSAAVLCTHAAVILIAPLHMSSQAVQKHAHGSQHTGHKLILLACQLMTVVHVQISDWALSTSMDHSVEPGLPMAACPACGKAMFAAALTCQACRVSFAPCMFSGERDPSCGTWLA